METAVEVKDILEERGLDSSVINARFVNPLDEELLEELMQQHSLVVTMEEGVAAGGFGESVAAWYEGKEMWVQTIALPNQFIEHGSVKELKEKYGLDKDSVANKILAWKEECK